MNPSPSSRDQTGKTPTGSDLAAPNLDLSDSELAERGARGDERAFFDLYRRHRRYVLTLVIRTAGRRADAEDLVQECFFQMHRSLPGFSGRSSFRTWFHGIVVRVCHSHTRNRLALRRRAESEGEWVGEDMLENVSDPNGVDVSESLALKDWIQQCLEKLSELHRVPLVMHTMSEMELGEIAQVLGIPEGSVKSRLFHARKRMATCLEAISP